jgi:ADP-ribose pyrophosphatase
MEYTEKPLRRINRYEGIIVNLQVDQVQLSNGRATLREVVEHPGGVTVLPVDENGYTYCVRQFRYPIGASLLEAPAGKLERGEDHRLAAARELSEETGITAAEFIYLGKIFTSPGFSQEALHIYLARGLDFGSAHPDENELLDVERIHLDRLLEMVMAGKIEDAKTVVAVLKAKQYLEG